MMPQWCLGHNKKSWGEDAGIFRPERWLKEEGESEENFKARLNSWKRVDASWGQGDVSCIGKNIALMEISKAVVEVSPLHVLKVFLGEKEELGN